MFFPRPTLRKVSIAVAVTNGRPMPQISDFSKLPGIYDAPCLGTELADPLAVSGLTQNALRSLLLMARFTVAYTNEVGCSLILGETASHNALKTLAKHGFIEHHPNDGNINAHLLASRQRIIGENRRGIKWNGD